MRFINQFLTIKLNQKVLYTNPLRKDHAKNLCLGTYLIALRDELK